MSVNLTIYVLFDSASLHRPFDPVWQTCMSERLTWNTRPFPPHITLTILHSAFARTHLYCSINDLFSHPWHRCFYHCDFGGSDFGSDNVHHIGRLEDEKSHLFDVDTRLGDVLLNSSLLRQWLAKRYTLLNLDGRKETQFVFQMNTLSSYLDTWVEMSINTLQPINVHRFIIRLLNTTLNI